MDEKKKKEDVIIENVIEIDERDEKIINDLGLNLKYGMKKKMNEDNVNGNGLIKKLLKG